MELTTPNDWWVKDSYIEPNKVNEPKQVYQHLSVNVYFIIRFGIYSLYFEYMLNYYNYCYILQNIE